MFWTGLSCLHTSYVPMIRENVGEGFSRIAVCSVEGIQVLGVPLVISNLFNILNTVVYYILNFNYIMIVNEVPSLYFIGQTN